MNNFLKHIKSRFGMNQYGQLPFIVFLAVIAQFTNGCTVAGYFVGKRADQGNFEVKNKSNTSKVSPYNMDWGGANLIKVHKKDSTILTGQFAGYKTEPFDQYRVRYDHFRDSLADKIKLPELQKALKVQLMGKDPVVSFGLFYGFTERGLLLEISGKTQEYPMDKLSAISFDMVTEYNVESLKKMLETNDLPSRTLFGLKPQFADKFFVPVDQVAYAYCQRNDKSGRIKGLITGIVIDISVAAIMVAVVVISLSNMEIY